VGIDFKPLAFEMHGAVSETFTKFFKKLAHAAAEENEIPYCVFHSYWQKRLSTTLQKYNAKALHLANNNKNCSCQPMVFDERWRGRIK
jgi:hypothetical protein